MPLEKYTRFYLPFESYWKSHLKNKRANCLFLMFMTARQFDDWKRLYRNLYWYAISPDAFPFEEEMEKIKKLTVKMLFIKADWDYAYEELLDPKDIEIVNDSSFILFLDDAEKKVKEVQESHYAFWYA